MQGGSLAHRMGSAEYKFLKERFRHEAKLGAYFFFGISNGGIAVVVLPLGGSKQPISL